MNRQLRQTTMSDGHSSERRQTVQHVPDTCWTGKSAWRVLAGLVLTAGLTVAWAAPAFATTYYVRKTCGTTPACTTPADTNDGLAKTTAFLTIGKAEDVMVAADTVYVGAGIYTEVVRPMAAGGTAGNPISYIADTDGSQTDDAGTVLVDGNGSSPFQLDTTPWNTYVIVDGFAIGIGGPCIRMTGATNIIIRNNTLFGCSGNGIQITGSTASGNTIENNIITTASQEGIWMENGADNTTIAGNVIFGTTAGPSRAAILCGGSDSCTGTIIRNNLLIGNSLGIATSTSAMTATIRNNTIVGSITGIDSTVAGDNLTIEDNLVAYNTNGINKGASGSTFTSANNLVYGNTTADYAGNAYTHASDVTTDPTLLGQATDGTGTWSLLFDGITVGDEDFAEVNDVNNALDVANDLTVEAWIQPDPHDPDASFVDRWAVAPNRVFAMSRSNAEDGLHVQISGDGTTVDCNAETGSNNVYKIRDAMWNHVAFSLDDAGNTLYLSINGQVSSYPCLASPYTGGTSTLRMGGNRVGGWMSGHIDEVRLSNSARYTADFVPPRHFEVDADTVGLWHFNEGTGQDVTDASANGLDGTLGATNGANTDDPAWANVDPALNARLEATATGHAADSPAIDAGSQTAAAAGVDTKTVRIDSVVDAGTVDIGYHYPITTLTENAYRWYDNLDALQPTTPAGDENTPITGVTDTTIQRLRLSLQGGGEAFPVGTPLKLQYAAQVGGACGGGDESWADIGAIGSGVIFRAASNSVTSGTTVSAGLLTPTDVLGPYTEAAQTVGAPSAIQLDGSLAGSDAEFDWPIQNNAAPADTYCFRVVYPGGQAFSSDDSGYTNYPEMTTGAPAVALSSAANQVFAVSQTPTANSNLTVTDGVGGALTAANDIRVKVVSPFDTKMDWDITDTTATITSAAAITKIYSDGATESTTCAASPCTATVAFPDSETLVIYVATDFASTDAITIADLKFDNFSSVNVAAVGLKLYKDGPADVTADASDDRTITIKGTLVMGAHGNGQEPNALNGTAGTSATDKELFAFRLTNAEEDVSVTQVVFDLSSITGIVDTELTNVKLWEDVNGDGAVDGGDTQVGGTPTIPAFSGGSGTITFPDSFTSTAGATDYLLEADVANLALLDTLTADLSVSATNPAATGVTSAVDIDATGSVTGVTHTSSGTLTLAEHGTAQETDKFSGVTGSITDAELFAFKLTNSAENISVTQLVLDLSSITGIVDTELTNVKLWADTGSTAGAVDGTDTQVGGTPTIPAFSGGNGTITFGTSFTVSVGTDYILEADVANLVIGDALTVALNVSATNPAATGVSSSIDVDATGSVSSVTHQSAGSLTLANHSVGQESDAFTTNASETGAELFAFRLTKAVENISVTQLVLDLSSITGIVDTELTNVKLWQDTGSTVGTVDGTDTQVGGTPTIPAFSAGSGTITFGMSFTVSAGTDYILQADVANLLPEDEMTVSLPTANITSTGVTSSLSITATGTATNVTHSQERAPLAVGDAKVYFGQSTATDLKERAWDDAGASWSSTTTTTTANATIKWVVTKVSPISSEELVGVLSDTGGGSDFDLLRMDGLSWTADWASTAITQANTAKRGFDLEYEAQSGEAMVVYSDNTTNPVYQTWNGSAWSGANPVFTIGTPPEPGASGGIVEWVELAARPGSDEIALVYADANSDLHAVVWTGTAWDEAGTETTLESDLSYLTDKNFDAAYEDTNGDLLVVWGHHVAATSGRVDYAEKPAGSGTFTTSTLITFGDNDDTLWTLDLASEPGSNRIAYGSVVDDASSVNFEDLYTGTWNGSSWVNHGLLLDDTQAPFKVAVGWVGTSGVAVAVHEDRSNSVGDIDWSKWDSTNGWVLQTDIDLANVVLGSSNQLQIENFVAQNKLMLLVGDTAGDLWAVTYDGTNWVLTNSDTALETTLSDSGVTAKSFSIAIAVNGTLALADHGSGQEPDAFTTNASETGAELFAFRLTNVGEDVSVTSLVIDLSSITGIVDTDLSAVKLWADTGTTAGAVDVSDTQVGGTPTIPAFSGGTGTITFGTSFTVSAGTNYILQANVANLAETDTVTVDQTAANVTASGVTSSETITVTGSATSVTHTQDGGGAAYIPRPPASVGAPAIY